MVCEERDGGVYKVVDSECETSSFTYTQNFIDFKTIQEEDMSLLSFIKKYNAIAHGPPSLSSSYLNHRATT